VTALASAGAYYFIFSLFPLALLATPLFSLVGDKRATVDFLLGQLQSDLPGDALKLVEGVIDQVVFARGATGVLSLGAVLTLWSASNIFSGLRDALNHAFGIRETRPWWRYTLIAFAFVIVASIVGLIATLVLLDGEGIVQTVASKVGLSDPVTTIWTIGQIPIAIGFVIGMAWAMYEYLPNACFARREALLSAVVATFLWIVVTILFRLYVQHFGSYNAIYGTIGAVIVLLTWMYLTMLAILIAGQVGAVVHAGVGRTAEAQARSPSARPEPLQARG
jgi:membrane protein